MERVAFTVRGDAAGTLPMAFHDIAEDDRELYDGDGFVIGVTENHYRFELTEVAATTVMELTDETTCEVTIIVGGGGYGVTATKGGRESEEARKLRRRIETFAKSATSLSSQRRPHFVRANSRADPSNNSDLCDSH